ncbi:MAG: radical SAM protein [Candidatus Aenigmarchaeota archaeon]|nr:radical SAM protein [Candidatus Aenigmarchaeota archaeon]
MKIMLIKYHNIGNINTRLPESINKVQGVYPPLGLAYVASTLEKFGHDVRILDSRTLNLTAEETKKHIEKIKPDVVGTTCMSSTIKGSLEALHLAKQVSKDIVTVIGGPQLFIYPKETTSYDFVDFGVAGEGEIVMPELLKALEGRKKFREVDGLVYKENGIKFTPAKRHVKDLDTLPFPSRHLLPNYKYFSILSDHPFTTLITSRGCPFKCGYCFRKKLDRIVRYRSAKNVVDEIQQCLEKWKFREIWFYDDTFTMNRKHSIQICKEIIDRGLDFKWEAVTRVDCVDREILQLMKDAGCKRIRYGIESGDQATLDTMKKGIKIEQIKKAMEWTSEVGMENFCFFMIGYPNENTENIKNTIDFAKNSNIDWAMFSNVTPYPATDLLELAHKKGMLKDREYWRRFTLGETEERIPYEFPGMDKWVKKAYTSFYLRPEFIVKKLTKMRSFRQVKKYIFGLYAIMNFKMFES